MKQAVLDLAYCNSVTDWEKVKHECSFLILRAGYGGESDQKDARFESHYKGAQGVGLKTLAYHYSYATTTSRARVEAQTCLNFIKGKDIPIVFYDVEEKCHENLSKEQLTNLCIAFCEVMEKAGYRAGIYANKYFLTEKLDYSRIQKYLIWVAQYNDTCTFNQHYDLWQYSKTGKVPGISGDVDLNYCYTDLFEKREEPPIGVQTYSKKKDGDTKLTANFKVREFACQDGSDSILIDVDGVRKLQAVRDLFGKPISINSAYRNKKHNAAVGGASNSQHLYGKAFDTVMSGVPRTLLAKAYEVAGMGCTIIYDSFVHTDTRTGKYYAYSDGRSMSTNLQTLNKGDKGQHVKDLQTALNRFAGAKLNVDGIFGSGTQAAVKAFQKAKKLTVDGICGKNTWKKLLTK